MRILVVVFISIFLTSVYGQNDIEKTNIDELFNTYDENTPGVSVLIMKDGKIIDTIFAHLCLLF